MTRPDVKKRSKDMRVGKWSKDMSVGGFRREPRFPCKDMSVGGFRSRVTSGALRGLRPTRTMGSLHHTIV
jgi:hypothetical protein